MTNQVPFNWDADFGPTDEELIARGSMPAFREQDDAGLLELMEKQAKEACGAYIDD